MQIVILSGGSGKRLWPLSNDVRSKQFIRILSKEDGSYESMVEREYRSIKAADPNAGVTIATSKTQVPSVINQLKDKVDICVEPCRRDTFPAIALAAAYLSDVKQISRDEAVVVCPVDPYVEQDYFETIKKIGEAAEAGTANLTLMGIKPTYPSEKYGYILVDGNKVIGFREKPDTETAKGYLTQGALWNGGVFGFKLGYMLDKAHELIDFVDYEDLLAKYADVTKISFDYAVAEHEKDIMAIPYDGQWKDIGTWSTLTEVIGDNTIGNVTVDDKCENVNAVNMTDVPLLVMGLHDVVVAAGPDGILVADKETSGAMKPYVDKFTTPVMYAEKSWGSFRIVDYGANHLTAHINMFAGQSMESHSHEKRDEAWTVISGEGEITINGKTVRVLAGDTIAAKSGDVHAIKAVSELEMIEVQTGEIDGE